MFPYNNFSFREFTSYLPIGTWLGPMYFEFRGTGDDMKVLFPLRKLPVILTDYREGKTAAKATL